MPSFSEADNRPVAIAVLPALERFEQLRATYRAFLEEQRHPAEGGH